MSDVAVNTETGTTERPSRSRALAVLFVCIAAVAALVLLERMIYTPEGISRNAMLTHLVLPAILMLVMLSSVVLIRKARIGSAADIVWYRWGLSEVVGAILVIVVVPTVYLLLTVLMSKLGLSLQPDLWFWADQRGLAFFITLTILMAIIGPALEEVFWRGYVQGTLERRVGAFWAWLGQAVLFAALHLRPVGGFVVVFVFGLMVGAWRWRRRTLLPIILAHIAVNSVWSAASWPTWLDCSRIKTTTDYTAMYRDITGIGELDPNDNARDSYEKTQQLMADIPAEWDQVKSMWPSHWSTDQRAAVTAWVSASEQGLGYVAEGAQKPFYWPDITGNIMAVALPDIAWARKAAYALCARSQLYAMDGELEDAVSDLAICLRLGDHLTGRRPLISQGVGIGIRELAIEGALGILRNTDVPPSTLRSLQDRFEQSMTAKAPALDFAVPRLVFHFMIQSTFTNDGNGDGYIPAALLKNLRAFAPLLPELSEQQRRALLGLDRRRTAMLADRLFKHLDAAGGLTAWQFQNNTNGTRKHIESIIERNAFIALHGQNYVKMLHIANRDRAAIEALVTTIAILRYQADKGQLPPSLEAAVDEGYLKALPRDTYSKGPLVYRQTGDDFVLYSLGADFDDDGGTPSKWGEGREGGDQVFWPPQSHE
ncbi:MAG: CPBP family intramembrane metalloprotease [Phycisphaerales bacterium]|nr:MAG: CPBP family intramembrane metalloprotease [Phycisphaerales bacterium]